MRYVSFSVGDILASVEVVCLRYASSSVSDEDKRNCCPSIEELSSVKR